MLAAVVFTIEETLAFMYLAKPLEPYTVLLHLKYIRVYVYNGTSRFFSFSDAYAHLTRQISV